ncbi:hypothetical protein MYCTH_2305109 [Thermothelomyces thermophilus ATCC 42464]|uniref:Uncharacterized protein n=1 Tax=Thermothelomyces thermophilus (strain ATCC 42464 / BCRC 31852 / DSM 1799) TaxID=573729 RepID=G2QC45_THET4|nr:uncharacterized protein MYCTH_2305109 [Thermothelomyces thermophilus ATCC 42464]AEO58074.1 hypothetical protein MYCTH_2305109 [Thermothelomyces thermophilus ATCC 42464]
METISKAASAASKAIRGENRAHGEEPVSGKMGNVAAGEPYDAGNMDPKDAAGASTPSQQEGAATAARTTGTTVPEPMTKPEPEAATKPRFVDERPTTTTTTTTTEDPAAPAKSAPSAHGVRGDSTKAQSDTRPPDASASSTAAAGDEPPSQSRRSTGDATMVSPKTLERDNDNNDNNNENREEEGAGRAVNLQGPGPRPLEQVAREHGGDAGAVAASEPAGGHQRRDSGKGLGAEDEGAARGKGEDEYFRSSGLAADGGDFDASRRGAGREADREYFFL